MTIKFRGMAVTLDHDPIERKLWEDLLVATPAWPFPLPLLFVSIFVSNH